MAGMEELCNCPSWVFCLEEKQSDFFIERWKGHNCPSGYFVNLEYRPMWSASSYCPRSAPCGPSETRLCFLWLMAQSYSSAVLFLVCVHRRRRPWFTISYCHAVRGSEQEAAFAFYTPWVCDVCVSLLTYRPVIRQSVLFLFDLRL